MANRKENGVVYTALRVPGLGVVQVPQGMTAEDVQQQVATEAAEKPTKAKIKKKS